MENAQFTITVMKGLDGGRIIYEATVDEYGAHESRLVFGGNPDEASKYVAERIAKQDGEQPKPVRQIDGPVKIRARRKTEPTPLDVLDALEMAEDVA
jgi:hypothetical protein